MFNPIVKMLHNVEGNRWHPIVFVEKPLPGPPDPKKPVRYKSKMHHTSGYSTRDEAVIRAGELMENLKDECVGEPKLQIPDGGDIQWDGEGVPTIVSFTNSEGIL